MGANLGNRLETLETVCEVMRRTFGSIKRSHIYETEPVDCPDGSPAFLNLCLEVQTNMPAHSLLQFCLGLEAELGRERHGIINAPRTCDIDLLYCGEEIIRTPQLTIPHPRLHQRAFVLKPLCDIAADFILPDQTLPVCQLLDQLQTNYAVTFYQN